jgi:hypothetical protein
MLGLRRFGIFVSVVTLTTIVLENARLAIHTGQIDRTLVVGSAVAVAGLWFWITVVKPAWAEIAANAYARELLAACDTLSGQASRKAPAKVRS